MSGVSRQQHASGSGDQGTRPGTPRVRVYADDDLETEAVAAVLAGRAEVTVADPHDDPHDDTDAEVTLVFTRTAIPEPLDAVENDTRGRPRCLVLVADEFDHAVVERAAGLGLAAILPRPDVTWTDIVGAILRAARGTSTMPTSVLELLRCPRRDRSAAAPTGDDRGTLTAREASVLRRFADGAETTDVARYMGVSDRTVKYIVHGIVRRHGLRNRTHAVAFAIRRGLV